MTMVKISSDLKKKFKSTHVTPRGFTATLVELEITSSRGPDQQHRQRVYRHLGVQQALVLFQINRKHSRYISVENIRPFWSLTYLN